jgi:hypothetical protein
MRVFASASGEYYCSKQSQFTMLIRSLWLVFFFVMPPLFVYPSYGPASHGGSHLHDLWGLLCSICSRFASISFRVACCWPNGLKRTRAHRASGDMWSARPVWCLFRWPSYKPSRRQFQNLLQD